MKTKSQEDIMKKNIINQGVSEIKTRILIRNIQKKSITNLSCRKSIFQGIPTTAKKKKFLKKKILKIKNLTILTHMTRKKNLKKA